MASRQQRKFRSLVRKWKQRLWLGPWYISFEYPEELDEDRQDNWQVTAQVKTQPAYKTAFVSIAARGVKDMSEVNMNRQACHEVVHVALSPLNDMCREVMKSLPIKQADAFDRWRAKENEYVTEHLTSVLLDAYKEKQAD